VSATVMRLTTGAQTNGHAMSARSLKGSFICLAVALSVVLCVAAKLFRAIAMMGKIPLVGDGRSTFDSALRLGHLPHHASAASVCPAIREVHKGNTFFSPSIPSRLRKRNRKE
jgi:hypothetical protein